MPDQDVQAVAVLRQETSDEYSDVRKALANGKIYDDET